MVFSAPGNELVAVARVFAERGLVPNITYAPTTVTHVSGNSDNINHAERVESGGGGVTALHVSEQVSQPMSQLSAQMDAAFGSLSEQIAQRSAPDAGNPRRQA